jgi:hypothetical protein
MTEGFTDFGANIKLHRDGTAEGEFICAIPNLVVLASQAATWSAKADGSIKVVGSMYAYFAETGESITDCETTIVFRAGGPGVGGFDITFCLYEEGSYDTEVVRNGEIDIITN